MLSGLPACSHVNRSRSRLQPMHTASLLMSKYMVSSVKGLNREQALTSVLWAIVQFTEQNTYKTHVHRKVGRFFFFGGGGFIRLA